VILVTTDDNSLSGTIPTEIGQLTKLALLHMSKYDGCLGSLSCPILYLLTHILCP
jgi:hypothetical protein